MIVFRGGDEKRVTLTIPRAKCEPPALSTRWERDVGDREDSGVRAARRPASSRPAIDEASKRGVSKLVLDVRGAIGGEVADAAAAASLFVGKGLVARVVSRKARAPPLEATGEKIWKGRTVVLDRRLDGRRRGGLRRPPPRPRERDTVGETTVGMAVVQRQVPTPSGGMLWMTVARYVSPSGTVLGGKGLSPDERVLVLPGERPRTRIRSSSAASRSPAARRSARRRSRRCLGAARSLPGDRSSSRRSPSSSRESSSGSGAARPPAPAPPAAATSDRTAPEGHPASSAPDGRPAARDASRRGAAACRGSPS